MFMVNATPWPIDSRGKNPVPLYRRLGGRHGLYERPAHTELNRLRSPVRRVNSMFCTRRSPHYPVIIRRHSSLVTAYKRVIFHNTYIRARISCSIEDEE